MSRFHSYLNSATTILSKYEGKEPLAVYLKSFFAAHKKYGSRDRKLVSHLCYCALRLGKAGAELSIDKKIIAGLFVCSPASNELLEELAPEWNTEARLPIPKKIGLAGLDPHSVFPWEKELSPGLDHALLVESFFIQPDLFLRIRPGHKEKLLQKLQSSEVVFECIEPSTLRLSNSFKVHDFFDINKEVVVQDLNSQRIGELMKPVMTPGARVWDCCAASGGKSIMAYDMEPTIDLVVSDIRESILQNLENRFRDAGIRNYKSFIADLSIQKTNPVFDKKFDLIIADVPCTGSGTWSRTPEQLAYFESERIEHYASLQRKIVSHLVENMKPGGKLLYITCSVFKLENEEQVDYLREKFNLKLIEMELFKGYSLKADCLFAALLERDER